MEISFQNLIALWLVANLFGSDMSAQLNLLAIVAIIIKERNVLTVGGWVDSARPEEPIVFST